MSHAITWYEIPVNNLERAVKFYGEVFQKELKTFKPDESRTIALMPPGAGTDDSIQPQGTLLHVAGFEPSLQGTIIYFDPVEALEVVLARVEGAGGKITFPKFSIGNGYLATFTDSEGNTIGLLQWNKPEEN